MKVQYRKFIWRDDLKLNVNKIYIFGDNVKRVGLGGQAKEMRGEPNAFGIATKLAPTYDPDDFMKDTVENLEIVMNDFQKLYELLDAGFYVYGDGNRYRIDALVIPEDGIGTGIANLKGNAPLILRYIQQQFKDIQQKWNI